jgi:hypothetical protein
MSDTPRTDAETYVWEKGTENPFVHKEFAQQLERELNASLENQVKSMEKLVEQQDFTLKAAVLLSEAVSQRDQAIEIAGKFEADGLPRDGFMLDWKVNKHEFSILKEKIRLATSPEEAETSAHIDKCIGNVTEPTSDWRNLGPEEVIQKGDEVLSSKGWIPAIRTGRTKLQVMAYRTRRPLPKPKLTRESYDEDWNLKSEQAALRKQGKVFVDPKWICDLEMELTEKTNEVARLTELAEWYKDGMESCWHAANTYDGNYVKACDNVMHIASERLLVKEELKPKIK